MPGSAESSDADSSDPLSPDADRGIDTAIDNGAADEPWRLGSWVDAPEWLRVGGHLRFRWEGLDGQFRGIDRLDRTDHYFLARVALRADVDLREFDLPVGATVELLDARQFNAGEGSAIGSDAVNPIDVLQAFGEFDTGEFGGGKSTLRVGRETIDLGSRRLVARNRFRNTINAFDGGHWSWRGEDGAEVDAFFYAPVQREPRTVDRSSLLDNDPEWDKIDFDNLFWGVFGAADTGLHDTRLDGYFYGLDENGGVRSREIYTSGFRFFRSKKPGTVDFSIESAGQLGQSRRASTGLRDLDHAAWFAQGSVAYTFDAPWRPNVRLSWDYASGDENPNDGRNGRFDFLFGVPHFEFGPAGIYRAVIRSNLNSPELRLGLQPASNIDAYLAWRSVRLAEGRDTWTAAGVTDPSGAAGTHVGEQFAARIRWNVVPDSLRLEVGGAYMIAGRFQDDAPNGQGRDTAYGYTQFIWTF